MKKHSLWFIVSLTCLACGCDNILTFSANECDEGGKICVGDYEYICTDGKWNSNGNACNQAGCTELDKNQCVDGKITICQKVGDRQEWVKTDETCITCNVDETKCSDAGKTLVCQMDDNNKYDWIETEETCIICVIGETKCSDEGKTLVCQKDGDKYIWSETGETCGVICNADDTKCNSGKIFACQLVDEKYDWVETEEKCGNTCNTDDTKCEGGSIYTCTAEGKWGDSPVECENGCSEGSVQPKKQALKCYDCGMDKVECDNSILTICNNHKLDQITCTYGCMKSSTSAYCRECAKGETKCEKGAIYECGDNGKWDTENKQECAQGCFNGERNAEMRVSCYECNTDNELECFTDNGTSVIKKCLSHKWYAHTTCEFGCLTKPEVQCKECQDGTSKFYNDEDDFCVEMTCKDNHYIEEATSNEVSCNRTLTGVGDCKNGDVKCFEESEEKGIFQFCLDGSWNNFGSCDPSKPCSVLNDKKCEEFQSVGHICVNDVPVTCTNKASCDTENKACAACQNGTSYCNGTSIMACVNGVSEETACQPGTHCEYNEGIAQCVTSLCENGQQRCEGQEIQYCINYKWHTVNACSDQELCAADNDIARCDCKSDIAYCNDDRQFTTCNDGMWHVTYCDENELCKTIAGKPKCIECEAGQFKCKDEAIISCQGNKWTEPAACTDNGTCKDSEGNAKCICTQGQAKCAKDNTKIIRCQENGQYSEEEETCGEDMHCEGIAGSAVCTKDQMECTPGAKQCKENSLETCNEKGKWVNAVTCEKGCNVNTQSCNACRAGEYSCSEIENYDYICADGQWKKRDKCQYGCDGAQCHSCMDEIKTCYKDSVRFYCEDNKTWGDIIENCPLGCNIKSNTCNKCKPGTTQCYACGYETCSKEGNWDSQLTELCPLGCSNGQCVSVFLSRPRRNLECIEDKEGVNRIVAYENYNLSSIGYVICDNSVTCDAFKYLCEKECGEVKSVCLKTSYIEYQKATYPYQTAISLRCNKPNNSFTFSAPCSSRECANEMSCANVKLNQFPQQKRENRQKCLVEAIPLTHSLITTQSNNTEFNKPEYPNSLINKWRHLYYFK